MKIKKMNIEYRFSQIPSLPKPHLKHKSLKSNICFLTNSNLSLNINAHSKPSTKGSNKKTSSIANSKPIRCILPPVGQHADQSDVNTDTKPKHRSRLHSVQHIGIQRLLENEFFRLKAGHKGLKDNFSLLNHNAYEIKDSSWKTLSRHKHNSMVQFSSINILMKKRGRNKKIVTDSCTQTCEDNEAALKKSKSKVVDLSFFIPGKRSSIKYKLINSNL